MITKKDLYRDPDKGKIAGVCAGLAEYFGMELWLVRILVVSAFFLSAGTFVIVSYIAAWFILDKKPGSKGSTTPFNSHRAAPKPRGKGWHNEPEDEEKVVVKSKVWQAGEPPKQAFFDIQQRFAKNESRLRKVETYVTSSEYQLNREISRL
ncbi:envelope stress response membrane protein PspC [Paraglaciecola sp.]|uniref:envelope stress response membrane protein PspC n=1 Tax=Paraglaciecola sp. TaxID=1920173 RepID=UPI0030F39288